MIVWDASATVELLLAGPRARAALEPHPGVEWHAPELWSIEVVQALRGLARGRRVPQGRAAQAFDDLRMLPVIRHRHEPLESRVWELRAAISAYDAAYVALAEALGAALMTADAGLARAAAGLVEVIGP